MPCACHDLKLLPESPATLYFISDIPEITRKLQGFLKERALFSTSRGMIRLSVDNLLAFFEIHAAAFREYFKDMETQRIKFYYHEHNARLQLEALLFAKTLDYYLNIIEDKGFFEILREQSLTSHFQPIVDVHSRGIVAYEALARGVNMDGTLMYPGDLFAKAQRNDLIFMLDRLARESALKTAAVKKLKTKIFINFIPTAIYDPSFCLNSTVAWAKQLHFDPSQIVFEVVETQHITDQEHLKHILTYYREQGFKIALDDVGEGYSSLNMLINLRPDVIKVDRAIIDGIANDPLKQSIYCGLAETAKTNGIELLAEGVEQEADVQFLLSHGVDMIQGYYFGKPAAEPLRRLQRNWPQQGESHA